MKRILLSFALISLANLAFAQTFREKFRLLSEKNDTAKIKNLLVEWEKSDPNDPELYTSAINFYFSNSKQAEISLDSKRKGNGSFQLNDSTGKVAGYLNSNPAYRSDQLAMGFKYINKGIEKFPKRLDMRFGKCYVLEQIADYELFTTEVIRTIEYSRIIKNDWFWTNSKKLENAEHFMLKSIQTYLKELYDTENDNLLENMKRIGAVTIKYYPNNVEILSTTAVANTLTKNYDIALVYLKQAEKINPKDFIVLNNIAGDYKLKGDKANAIKYYVLTEKYGDEEAKEAARRNIKELKK
jgi:hypothetical protein